MDVGKFLMTLKATPGAIAKRDLLRAHADDDTLKRVVRMALEPRLRFYATDVRMPAASERWRCPNMTITEALDFLEVIRLGRRGPTLKSAYEDTLRRLDHTDAYAVWCVLNKDLRAGVQTATANKVWPDLIYIHPYMGAKPDNKANRTALKIEDGAYVEVKADGMYFDAVVRGGSVEFYTRWGLPLNMTGTTLERNYEQQPDGVYQGEGLISDNGGWLSRDDGNGIIRRAIEGEIPDMYKDRLYHVVWDYVPYDDWCAGVCPMTRAARMAVLKSFIPAYIDDSRLRLIKYALIDSWEEAQSFYSDILRIGGEGAIAKRADGKWKSGKPTWQVKMKVEEVCELLIVDTKEDKKNPGLIGSFVVVSACGGIKTAAGGLTNKQKRTPPEYFIGKVGRFRFNDLSSTGESLSHPRVDGEKFLRAEGSAAHTVEDIREIFADAIK